MKNPTTREVLTIIESVSLKTAKEWNETYEKYTFCIDLLEISAHWDRADRFVNRLEFRFERLLRDAGVEVKLDEI